MEVEGRREIAAFGDWLPQHRRTFSTWSRAEMTGRAFEMRGQTEGHYPRFQEPRVRLLSPSLHYMVYHVRRPRRNDDAYLGQSSYMHG